MEIKTEKLSKVKRNYEFGYRVEFLLDLIARYDSTLEIQIRFVENTYFSKEIKKEVINQLKERSLIK